MQRVQIGLNRGPDYDFGFRLSDTHANYYKQLSVAYKFHRFGPRRDLIRYQKFPSMQFEPRCMHNPSVTSSSRKTSGTSLVTPPRTSVPDTGMYSSEI